MRPEIRLLADLSRGCTGRETRLYFIRGLTSGRIKIGVAGNVASRLKILQTGSPEPLALLAEWPCRADLEARIHDHFARCRTHGEWFDPTDDLLAFANAIDEFCLREGVKV